MDQLWFWVQHNISPTLAGALIGAAIAAVIAYFTLRVNAGINIRNKRIDVIVHCNNRYDELYQTRLKIEQRADDRAVRSYFRRYWGLKSDQIDYWLAGYVDPETITSWFMSTVDAFLREGVQLDGDSFLASLPEMRRNNVIVNQRLLELVDFITDYIIPIYKSERGRAGDDPEKLEESRAKAYAALLGYFDFIERDEEGLISQLSRHSLRRLTLAHFVTVLRPKYRAQYQYMTTIMSSVEADDESDEPEADVDTSPPSKSVEELRLLGWKKGLVQHYPEIREELDRKRQQQENERMR